ncbi:glycosyltransferase family 4 protein [Priestia megaterium]|uniref:glycosyltransferase family 4 protein n=1 Tax=Priestia megaterium TaxID=1404 RepID=UPI00317C0F57
MKILIISLQRLPAFGGVNSYVFDLSKQLKKQGHEVELLCGEDINSLPTKQMNKVNFFMNALYKKIPDIPKVLLNYEVGVFAFKELFQNVNMDEYDIVHSQDGIVSKAFKTVYPNIPLIGTIHGCFYSELTGLGFKGDVRTEKMFKRYDQWSVSYPDFIITPSAYKDNYMPYIPEYKHIVINHGIDVNTFGSKETTRKINTLKVCTAGSLHNYKGLDILLKALRYLENDGLDYVVDIYGDGPERERLESFSKNNHLMVNFKGSIGREELWGIYSTYDVFVQPSRVESFGLSVTEAMANMCVPICSAIGGLQDQVKDMENGLLFESENSYELYTKIKLIAYDEKLASRLSLNARKAVETKFSIESMCEKTLNAYKNTIASTS